MPANEQTTQEWRTVNDSTVRHIWIDDSGKEHTISPGFYEEAGTPIDEHSGRDMTYDRTEVLQ